jgi:hypothetical protein
LYHDFDAAFDAMFDGRIHHVIQVAVHPSVIQTVAKYRGRAHLIDAFISPSQPMAVLTRVTYRKFKGHFSADPSGAQPAKRPLEYPGSGKVAVVFTPHYHGMSQ